MKTRGTALENHLSFVLCVGGGGGLYLEIPSMVLGYTFYSTLSLEQTFYCCKLECFIDQVDTVYGIFESYMLKIYFHAPT